MEHLIYLTIITILLLYINKVFNDLYSYMTLLKIEKENRILEQYETEILKWEVEKNKRGIK